MHFYVRKDLASQIWNLGVGDGEVENVLLNQEVNVCNANWQLRAAETVFGTSGTAQGQLNRPVGLAVGDDGSVYVAEESNNRVSVFDANGAFQTILGQTDAGTLLARPNSVAVAPDGNLVVADTWNYQVKVMSPEDGRIINQWGEAGEFGLSAQIDPVYGLWGPRDVAVDADGRIYVSDTGNKRIRVYSSDGRHLRDIGSGGSNPGQLDEPSGMALHPDGRLFVADYWNRRISVFNTEGDFEYTFPVRAWFDEQGNRPYVAVDAARDMVYVSDPDAGRILVYDTAGNCLGSFGQPSREGVDATQFRTTAGIATDAQGNVYVTDSGTGRVLRFSPFEAAVAGAGAGDGRIELDLEATEEVTDEILPAITEEMTEELTEEATEEFAG
jgi:DNA-binding beta-propeller fold protein YncE